MAETNSRKQRSQNAKKSRQTKKPTTQTHGRAFRIFRAIAIAFVVVLVSGGALFAWYAKDAPKLTKQELQAGGGTTLYTVDNKPFATLGSAQREYVTSKEIPDQLKDAIVSVEDRRFYSEKLGIDPIRIVGALFSNVKARITGNFSGLEGGSTLTQQLVKLSVFSTKASDQTLKRKAQEAWLAMQVERTYSKQQILEFYVNKVYMNYSQYGMGTGARFYYDKKLKDLNLPQTAFIAGLGQSPVGYDPYIYPQRAKARRDDVLRAMLREGKITKSEANKAIATPITDGLVPKKQTTLTAHKDKVIDAYLTSVIDEVKDKMAVNPYTANMKIYTNLDLDTQTRLYDIVNSDQYVYFPDDLLQTAVTVADPNTGNIIAQIGGRKNGDVRLGFNRATRSNRSNGSTMKPLMDYGPAIEYLNYSTYEQVNDTPYKYPGTNTSLSNFSHDYLGRISIRQALTVSQNIPAIRTLDQVGVPRALTFLKGLGIKLPKEQQVISSGIGASVTTEQEAAAYGAFANGGTYHKPQYVNKVVEADGKTTKFKHSSATAMKSSTAYMITDMLKDVITTGTGTGAAISGVPQAGKTGTTDYGEAELANNPALSGLAKDSWFTGYTPHRVVSVWIGYDQANKRGMSMSTRAIASSIYRAIMAYMMQSLPADDWEVPDTVLVRHILRGSNPGTAITGNTAGTTRELYVRGYGPTTEHTVAPEEASETSSSEESSSTSSSVSSSSSSSVAPESSSSEPAASSSSSVPPTTPESSSSTQ